MSQIKRQEKILSQFKYGLDYHISAIQAFDLEEKISIATLKRDLKNMTDQGFLFLGGKGKISNYTLSGKGLIRRDFNTDSYFSEDPYTKTILDKYNFGLLGILGKEMLFSEEENRELERYTKIFREKNINASDAILKKELERFVIELSWKSSKIEGNTYTLLDTEKLLRDGIVSESNTKEEADMIINHKKAFNYILDLIRNNQDLSSFRELENIHRLLVLDLGINHGIRKSAVGITGAKYMPLDIFSQIEEETKKMLETIKLLDNNFSKALLAILFISYLQSFEDGNKRTARLFANGILISFGLAPLSYRDVDEKKYREVVLIFYEQNSIQAFKKIFIEQYIFSCKNYNLKILD